MITVKIKLKINNFNKINKILWYLSPVIYVSNTSVVSMRNVKFYIEINEIFNKSITIMKKKNFYFEKASSSSSSSSYLILLSLCPFSSVSAAQPDVLCEDVRPSFLSSGFKCSIHADLDGCHCHSNRRAQPLLTFFHV